MFVIYSFLYFLAAALLLPFEYAKRPVALRKRWLKEKLGFIDLLPVTRQDSTLLWIHAVSMGEVISATPFIREIRKRYPAIRIIVSTITDTGQKVARERVADIADVVYLPFDLGFILKRVVGTIKPDAFITIETELWPNIFRICSQKRIPVLVMNGRLSDKSFKGYKRIRFFIKGVLQSVDMFGMQDETYAERIEDLGVERTRITVTGNFKYDTRPQNKLPEWSELLRGQVILAGSTHEGEEEIIVSVAARLGREIPGLTLILAPRHPERFAVVEERIRASSLPCIRSSEMTRWSAAKRREIVKNQEAGGSNLFSGTSVVILDSVGELASLYGICDVAVIGGSFIEHGGHNPLEPAFWGKPILCGPHMENFPFIGDFYREGAARESDTEGLYDHLKDLIQSPERRKAMGEKAKALHHKKAGAVDRAIAVLECHVKLSLPLSHKEPFS
jgi:3-deoxy-D-manno-octulosonic-acid transferase